MFLRVVLLIGFILSSYASYVEFKNEQAKHLGTKYTALCDFGMFSCTKVFSSEFGYVSQFFGLPKISNAHVGMAFYVFELLIHRKFPKLFLLSSGASCLGSIGLFYLLTVKLNDFCIVCMSIYVVNFTSFFTIYRRLSRKRSSKRGAEAPERNLQAPETKKMR